MATPNERITEDLVRKRFEALGYFDVGSPVAVSEQRTDIDAIRRRLKGASKTGKGGVGAPEFIVSALADNNFILVVECKASTTLHQSQNLDQPAQYAVDGALHYARHLSTEFSVIAVAVSGQSASQLKISTFLHAKGASSANELTTKSGAAISKIIPWTDYVEHAMFDPSVQRLRQDELMEFSRELHDFMFHYAKLTESEKPLLVSGTLIALHSKAFASSFHLYKPEELQRQWLKVIQEELDNAQLPQAKKRSMVQPYSTIAVHPELAKPTGEHPKGALYELIRSLNEKVWPFINIYHDFDVVGQFYGEFLKYTGGDKKALGIVLTPRHVTDLFARLANVTKESTVLDSCAGTGGFLVSAMHHMMRSAMTTAEKNRIKGFGLIGVEQQPNMFALAASNMILRGDGKANLSQGSCFDPSITAALRQHQCDVGMINPPYSQGANELHELVFVKHMLDCLVPGGIGIAIIPLAKVIAPHVLKHELLAAHTLEAVMTMPHELFYPVARAACIVVFSAHQPHAVAKKKTWFAYWKDDRFVKTKHLGRTDLNEEWSATRDAWVEAFRNRDSVPGITTKKAVGADDEWCGEAYMSTDYKAIGKSALSTAMKRYISHKLMERELFVEAILEGVADETD